MSLRSCRAHFLASGPLVPEAKLAALRVEAEDKELGPMAWVLKMDDATIESGLVHDFDASLSGIGQELGAGAYSMRLELREGPHASSGLRTRNTQTVVWW